MAGELCCRWYSVPGVRLAFLTRTALADWHTSEPRLQPVLGETVGLRPGLPAVGDGVASTQMVNTSSENGKAR